LNSVKKKKKKKKIRKRENGNVKAINAGLWFIYLCWIFMVLVTLWQSESQLKFVVVK
jgi:cell division septal protein FtsQ